MAIKPISELRNKIAPEVLEASERHYEKLKVVYSLGALRDILEIRQKDIQGIMKVSQPAISRIEKSEDIEAAGGKLELHARFNDEDILIANFSSKNKPSDLARMGRKYSAASELVTQRIADIDFIEGELVNSKEIELK